MIAHNLSARLSTDNESKLTIFSNIIFFFIRNYIKIAIWMSMRFLQAPGPRVTSAGLIVQEACIAPFLRQPPSVEQNWSNFRKIATLRRNMPVKRLTADNDKRTIEEGRVVADSLLLLLLLPSLPPDISRFVESRPLVFTLVSAARTGEWEA